MTTLPASGAIERILAAALAVIVALSALTAVLTAVGCQDRKVKVEISAAGDSTGRVFITNQTDRESLEIGRASCRERVS